MESPRTRRTREELSRELAAELPELSLETHDRVLDILERLESSILYGSVACSHPNCACERPDDCGGAR